MRPGRTQTGMGLYWSSYISSYAFTRDSLTMNSDQSDFVLVAGPRQEILVPV